MSTSPAVPVVEPVEPRFSWPVRIVIFLVLFDMLFRSTDVLYPWGDWLSELKIERMPRPLPTRGDLEKLCADANGSYRPALEELGKSFASVPRYLNPAPSEETVALLDAEQIRWDGLRLNRFRANARRPGLLSDGQGFVVMAVDRNSPALNLGFEAGDVLCKVNGALVSEDVAEFNKLLSGADPGRSLEVVVLRHGKEVTLSGKELDEETAAKVREMTMTAHVSRFDAFLMWFKYTLAWTASRLQWCEAVLNIDQEWPMFSPNVGKKKYPARARLIYEDGTEATVRQRSDPEDLTNYIRWGPGKYLGYDRGVSDDSSSRWYACPGWCNFLSYQHPVNANGSPLKEIRLYQVRYDFPEPNADPREFFVKQMEETRDHRTLSSKVYTTFFRYWPKTQTYEFVRCYQTRHGLTALEE